MGALISILLSFVCGIGVTFILMRMKNGPPDGQIVVATNDEGKITYVLELNGDPADLKDRQMIRFKVTDRPSEGYDEAP
jgi:hypothetical protein